MEKRISKTDTTRSWRAMRKVVCWLCALVAAWLAFNSSHQVTWNLYLAEVRRADDASSKAIKDETDAEFAQYNGKIDDAKQYRENAEGDRKNAADIKAQLDKDYKAGVYNSFWYDIGQGLLAGIFAWIGAWLLIVGVAFIWWFILDRIREAARAAKGEP